MQFDITRSIAISCRNLTKAFGAGESRVEALRGIDLEVRAGELTMLMGPSGCGKTTVISVIAGLLNATAGDVRTLNVELGSLSADQLTIFRRTHIGFVFQQYQLLPSMTAIENAAVPLIIAGVPRRRATEQAAALLTQLGLAERLRAFPAQLSNGQQQRVAIARALIHKPRLLLCDEPTAALDAHSGHLVMELLRKVALSPERAVIVVTHDNRVLSFADRIVEIDDGRIVHDSELALPSEI